MGFKYSEEMIDFLREKKVSCTMKELTNIFNKRFSLDKTIFAIKRVCFDRNICGESKVYDERIKQFIKNNIYGISFKKLTELVNLQFGLSKSERQIKSYCIYHKLYNGKGIS